MTRLLVCTILAAALVAGLGIPQAWGQTETIQFTLKLARGDVLYYADAGSFNVKVEAPTGQTTLEGQYQARQVVRVLDVEPPGVMLTEVASEGYRLSMGRRTDESPAAPYTIKVRPDGRIIEKVVAAEHINDYPHPLPGRPVRVGESWTREMSVTQVGITGRGAGTFTLTGVTRSSESRVARVRYTVKGVVTGADVPMPPGAEASVRGTFQESGEFDWLVERGRMARSSSELTMNLDTEVTLQGQSIASKATVKAIDRLAPLAPEAVPAQTVAPEFLIVPGRAVGRLSLDTHVADLTDRLGLPTPIEASGGLRARGLDWPTGLAAYVDEDDADRLIGLAASNARYRTGGGIGFGSSQGAVMMAYGMFPSRVDLTMPGLGALRVLIYNDLGIAFAITADKARDRGPLHAPVGAVDAITIFPPGTAGRIYPLP